MGDLTKSASLRERLSAGQVYAPCVWDSLTAHVAQEAGFEAMVLESSSFSTLGAGLPDIGLVTAEELVRRMQVIGNHAKIPVIVDCDDGYGETPLNAYLLIKRLVLAGASAVIIEDTTGFRGIKRTKIAGAAVHETVSLEDWLTKIQAALEGSAGTGCLVIASTVTDAAEEAITRCQAAKKLGADIVMASGGIKNNALRRLGREVPGLKMWQDNGNVDMRRELQTLGFELVSGHILESAGVAAMLDVGQHVLADQNTVYADSFGLPMRNGIPVPSVGPGQPWLEKEDSFRNTVRAILG